MIAFVIGYRFSILLKTAAFPFTHEYVHTPRVYAAVLFLLLSHEKLAAFLVEQ